MFRAAHVSLLVTVYGIILRLYIPLLKSYLINGKGN